MLLSSRGEMEVKQYSRPPRLQHRDMDHISVHYRRDLEQGDCTS